MSSITDTIQEVINSGNNHLELKELPRVLFNATRIIILNDLAYFGETSYSELKTRLKVSDGTLSSHIRQLIDEKIIDPKKGTIENNKAVTRYLFTKSGWDLFDKFVDILEELFIWKRKKD
ncbi:MAG: transcriptional regulator [Candidatus Heimdallarchaeota archaeon]|nr:transcriptional regulator [Candidatus Heimdallarchaeota archaeon]